MQTNRHIWLVETTTKGLNWTCEVDVRVRDGGRERSCDDSAKIDEKDPPPTVNHLQRDAEHQLHDDVEDDVKVAAVDQHVGEEPPDLPLLVRVEDQRSGQVGRSVGPDRDPRV